MIDLETRDLQAFEHLFKRLPDIADRAAQMAINTTARDTRALAAREMGEQVKFPRGYLAPRNDRLAVSRQAKPGDLEAHIRGRDRPTSLARFRVGKVKFGRGAGVRVQIAPDKAPVSMGSAFYMKLRRGSSYDPENANVGLAVRVRRGESLRGSTGALSIGGGLYLLYGPSVDQVFREVASDEIESVSERLADEFIRQFERLQ